MRQHGANYVIVGKDMLIHCHGGSDRRTGWTFTYYLVAIANVHIPMISIYLANTQANRIKIKIEPLLTQCVGATLACQKTAIVYRL